VRLKPYSLGPDRTARYKYNENLQSRTTLDPKIFRENLFSSLRAQRDHNPALLKGEIEIKIR